MNPTMNPMHLLIGTKSSNGLMPMGRAKSMMMERRGGGVLVLLIGRRYVKGAQPTMVFEFGEVVVHVFLLIWGGYFYRLVRFWFVCM